MIRITIVAPVLAALLFAAPACSKKKDDSAAAPPPQPSSEAQEAAALEADKAAQADNAKAPPTRLMIIAETRRKEAKAAAKAGAAPADESESKETPYRRVVRAPVFEKGERVVGDTDDIKLSYKTARKMDLDGEDKIAILARLCLDAAGTPTSATIVEGSGYQQADQSVRDEIMTWVYEPYSIDGKPVPFCELLTFRISLKDGLG